ncbi:43896_t:CDS:2, partial [Gigaspora margarita]
KVQKKSPNKKMHILEWKETNKENLLHNNPLGSSIVPTSKTLKMKKNEIEDARRIQNGICGTHRKLGYILDPKYNREYEKTTRTHVGIKGKPK